MPAKSARPEEQEAIDALLATHPTFAGEGIVWIPCNPDPPDFVGTKSNGERIGLELTEWLDPAESKKWFTRLDDEGFLTLAIASATHPKPKNFGRVQVNLKDKARIRESEATTFSAELYRLLGAIDTDVSEQRLTLHKPYHSVSSIDSKTYPTLSKYLGSLWLFGPEEFKIPEGGRGHWVVFPVRFLPHAPEFALKTLLERITGKTTKYTGLLKEKNLNELILLVHFGIRGFMQNTIWGYEDDLTKIVEAVRKELSESAGPFTSVFLYLRFNEGRLIRLK